MYPTGQQLSRAGAQLIPNNSYVRAGSIGTSLPVLCEYPLGSSAVWYRPDGNEVLQSTASFEKATRQETITGGQALYRGLTNFETEGAAGVYSCEITTEGNTEYLHAGIYSEVGMSFVSSVTAAANGECLLVYVMHY